MFSASLADYKEIIKLHIKCNYPLPDLQSVQEFGLILTALNRRDNIEQPGLGRDKMK